MYLPTWRHPQKQRRHRKFVFFVRLFILIILLTLILFSSISLLKAKKNSQLLKDSRVTIVLATQPIMVVSLTPQGEMTILSIPKNTYLETIHGFGSYRVGAVWSLGKQEKLGGTLLADTIQEYLAVPIDGWIGPSSGDQTWNIGMTKQEVISLKNSLTSWNMFFNFKNLLAQYKNIDTNLNILDITRLWYSIKNIRFDKINYINLGESSSLKPFNFIDGSQGLNSDINLIDITIKDLFKDKKIIDDKLVIEVVNSSSKNGMANRISRLITNMGGTVISISNNAEEQNNCSINGNDNILVSYTSQRLLQIYGCQKGKAIDNLRVDLQLVIGNNYWKKLFTR
ncbi:MAG: LytR C-terminal domain-containing protein [Candidatus Gottesmanbacteria bacterium]